MRPAKRRRNGHEPPAAHNDFNCWRTVATVGAGYVAELGVGRHDDAIRLAAVVDPFEEIEERAAGERDLSGQVGHLWISMKASGSERKGDLERVAEAPLALDAGITLLNGRRGNRLAVERETASAGNSARYSASSSAGRAQSGMRTASVNRLAHACEGASVTDVLRHVPLSRSLLERRFRKYLGRSPQAEIRAVQVKRVKQLLVETELPLKAIAELAGLEHVEYLSVVFKRLTGQSPGRYRRTFAYSGAARGRAAPPSPPRQR